MLDSHRCLKLKTAQLSGPGAVICVFLLCLAARVYWIHEKDMLYGDELTSICLAYNQPGWGENTYETGRPYTGDELRKEFYMDDTGGWEGWLKDITSLRLDNRDASHASLYYMALRTMLTEVDVPSTDTLVLYACGLNLIFFALSFLFLWLTLRALFPRRGSLVAFALLLAYLNPAAISDTLLVREYQMAEWLFALWVYGCVRTGKRIERRLPVWTAGTATWGVAASVALWSCGYFNLLFWGLTVGWLALYSIRRRAFLDLGFYVALGLCSLMLCILAYDGFFNFLKDTRMTDVTVQMRGEGGLAYLTATLKKVLWTIVMQVFTPVWTLATVGIVACGRIKKKTCLSFRLPDGGLFVCAGIWALVVLGLAPWKEVRFISPAVPLLLAGTACCLAPGLRRMHRYVTLLLMAAFVGYAFCPYPVEHLEKKSSRPWPAGAKRVLLFGPDAEEKNTLNLLIPYLDDRQECVIVERPDDLRRYALPHADTLFVYGAKNSPALKAGPGYRSENDFNIWMSVYTFIVR
ncbi:MAG: hypothetical protein LUC45_09065 [Paraprevotella sp.]|nr:hypothetical protein [Paraprevotella sp.]